MYTYIYIYVYIYTFMCIHIYTGVYLKAENNPFYSHLT